MIVSRPLRPVNGTLQGLLEHEADSWEELI